MNPLLAAVAAVVLAAPPSTAPAGQWHLDRIGVPQAQAVSQGDGVLVGMFLASVDTTLPALGGRVRPGKYVGSGGEIKDRPASADTEAGKEASTALAGLVVAQGTGGVLGVAPRAEIQPINGPVGEEKVSQALRWLTDQGAKVIDMSGGFTVDKDTKSIDGVNYALSKNVVVILDARQADRLDRDATTGVLVVGGVTEKGERDSGDSFDSRIDLSAPGATLGLQGVTGPVAAQGDQQASAITAGVAALILAKDPQLSAPSVLDRLIGTAKDAGPAGKDSTFGAGVVDAAAAVTADRVPVAENPLGDPGPPEGDGLPVILVGAAVAVAAVLLVVVLWLVLRRRRRS
ncbi:S8 family serine peptidase [Paractinoplanes rishiriensis]|uniref:Peptidase S8/S53 domain-containing protein n=1 Tax=Paractinoplanes rishiriensis TaxID=1050105 RepID=A0A919K6V6_9ACTN|nr:S8 family serine peptidase [Actinoplanes rishiriensis]GIF00001.1 hypothetical protein Ari01nite_74650 [Actinoplanes rishiriensis]